jgi:shikimate kinase
LKIPTASAVGQRKQVLPARVYVKSNARRYIMVIMLFGISGVGKTVTGKMISEKLKCSFFDLDEEIKVRYQITLNEFMNEVPYSYERGKIKGKILKDLLEEHNDNMVIAVSPIFYARFFNSLIDLKQVIAIELQDKEEYIFDRMVFSDESDNVYKDDAYKEQHREYYLKDIHGDIIHARTLFKKIKNKYFMNGRSTDQVVDDLLVMIQEIAIKQ